MPYYGDTPGQAAGLQLQDEASQRQYALGLAQQQMLAQSQAADLNFRKQAFQQGLMDSSLARSDQRALNDRTFAFEEKSLAAKTKQYQDASEASLFDDAKKMVASGHIADEPTLRITFGGRLGESSLETLARYGDLTTTELGKRSTEASKYAEGLNNQLKPLQDKLSEAVIALKTISETTGWFGGHDDRAISGATAAAQNIRDEIAKKQEALNKDLAKSHLNTVIAQGEDGIYKSTLPTDIKPFRLPKAVTRGLRQTPTAVASLGERAAWDPTTGWSGPGVSSASGIDAAGRWRVGAPESSRGLIPPEASYAGADDRSSAPPAAPQAPAPVNMAFVPIPGTQFLVRADVQRDLENSLARVHAQWANAPGHLRASQESIIQRAIQMGVVRQRPAPVGVPMAAGLGLGIIP